MKYQITYEDALRICEANDDFHFNKKEVILEGFRVVTFNYFICDYSNFETPIIGNDEIKAFDMRGVTFVFNEDGTLFRKYLMLEKFFNLNQVESTLYENVKHKKI